MTEVALLTPEVLEASRSGNSKEIQLLFDSDHVLRRPGQIIISLI